MSSYWKLCHCGQLTWKSFSFLLVLCVIMTLVSYQNVEIGRTKLGLRKGIHGSLGAQGEGGSVPMKAENERGLKSSTVKILKGNHFIKQNKTAADVRNQNSLRALLARKQKEPVYVLNYNFTPGIICPEGPLAGGPFAYNMSNATMGDVISKYPNMSEGGHWTPEPLCRPRYNVAIVVPYRDRPSHLPIFLNNLHKFLQLQFLEYKIYVVEQAPGVLFNRAFLMNAGYLEAKKIRRYDCYIFHDVDMIPMDTRNVYNCSDNPRHLAVARDKARFSMPYKDFFGGGVVMKPEHLEAMNGFTNIMFGWGAEDEEAYLRVIHSNLTVERYPKLYGRYRSILHRYKESGNPVSGRRYADVLKVHSVYKSDGINSIKYKLLSTDKEKLFTRFLVDVTGPKTHKDINRFIDEKLMVFKGQNNGENITRMQTPIGQYNNTSGEAALIP